VLPFADLFGSGSDLENNAGGSMHDSSRRHSRDNSVSNSTHLISSSSNNTTNTTAAAIASGSDATASNTAANATTTTSTAANSTADVGKKRSSDKVLRMFVWRYERFFALPGTPGKPFRASPSTYNTPREPLVCEVELLVRVYT
jgi:hypothetical protein